MKLSVLAQAINKNDLSGLPQPSLTQNSVNNGLRLVFAIAGATTLIVITIAALQYVISQGDPQKTAKAKNVIIYAFIGLTISAIAFSIVTFVLGRL